MIRQTREDSLNQKVENTELQPTLKAELEIPKPKPLPCIVIIDAPVTPALERLAALACTAPVDTPDVRLPTSPPIDNTTRPLPRPDPPPLHAIAVSDSHIDASHLVAATLALTLDPARPRPAPTTVTLDEPDAARFLTPTTLPIARAYEKPRLKLPARMPPVTAIPRLPLAPCDSSPRNALSDTHSLTALLLCPTIAPPLKTPIPRPAPKTVTLLDPDDPAFAPVDTLRLEAEYDAPMLKLPTRFPAVIDTPLLRRTPPLGHKHRAALSDAHSVDSH